MNEQIKTLELDPKKEYIIVVEKRTIERAELAKFPKREKMCDFLLVDDVNQVKLVELDTLDEWIKKQRGKLTK